LSIPNINSDTVESPVVLRICRSRNLDPHAELLPCAFVGGIGRSCRCTSTTTKAAWLVPLHACCTGCKCPTHPATLTSGVSREALFVMTPSLHGSSLFGSAHIDPPRCAYSLRIYSHNAPPCTRNSNILVTGRYNLDKPVAFAHCATALNPVACCTLT
jgi:hypothetical protein